MVDSGSFEELMNRSRRREEMKGFGGRRSIYRPIGQRNNRGKRIEYGGDITESIVKPTIHHKNRGKTKARLYRNRQEDDTVTSTSKYFKVRIVSYRDMCSWDR